jgi:hypothetical protein
MFIIDIVYCVVGNELRIIILVNLRRPIFTVYVCKIFKLVTVGEGAIPRALSLPYTPSGDLPSNGG